MSDNAHAAPLNKKAKKKLIVRFKPCHYFLVFSNTRRLFIYKVGFSFPGLNFVQRQLYWFDAGILKQWSIIFNERDTRIAKDQGTFSRLFSACPVITFLQASLQGNSMSRSFKFKELA